MNLILLGKPGSGKGTQAELLSAKLGLYYIQTGKLSRELAKKDKRIAKIVQSGNLIPEKVMTKYIVNYLEKNVPSGKNILFEGYPRFVSQYEDLENWLGRKGSKIDTVILLDISEEEVIKRLVARRICEKCGEVYNLITNPPPKGECKCGGKLIRRSDDNPESIRERFLVYGQNTSKVVDYARERGKLVTVNADRPINEIFQDILTNISS